MVIEQIREFAKNGQGSSGANDTLARFQDYSAWASLPPAEQVPLVQRVVQRVEYDGHQGKVAISFHPLDNQNSNDERTCREKEMDQ
jgi:hypothetical protein